MTPTRCRWTSIRSGNGQGTNIGITPSARSSHASFKMSIGAAKRFMAAAQTPEGFACIDALGVAISPLLLR